MSACTQPSGYVDNSEDCDDTSDLFRPGAIENDCEDPNDYNCDGSVGYEDADGDATLRGNDCDDADAGTYAPTLFYIDYDGDGFGSNFITQTACVQPEQHAANDTDDDLNADINPTAVEVCNKPTTIVMETSMKMWPPRSTKMPMEMGTAVPPLRWTRVRFRMGIPYG